ncbi:hypothetical protein ABW19_dt0207947 [Dactylella cylindrospora]|nr:hypothetical protein ABW19_dt0207947 [Dactylella cylindrospora]
MAAFTGRGQEQNKNDFQHQEDQLLDTSLISSSYTHDAIQRSANTQAAITSPIVERDITQLSSQDPNLAITLGGGVRDDSSSVAATAPAGTSTMDRGSGGGAGSENLNDGTDSNVSPEVFVAWVVQGRAPCGCIREGYKGVPPVDLVLPPRRPDEGNGGERDAAGEKTFP